MKLNLIEKRTLSQKRADVSSIIKNSPYHRDIIVTGYINDTELSLLLAGAKVFLYLSKIEGFGYAPLEAMASGVPVICARNSSLSEMLGSAPLWVSDAEDAADIAIALQQLIENKNKCQELSMGGLERVKMFRKEVYKKNIIALYNL